MATRLAASFLITLSCCVSPCSASCQLAPNPVPYAGHQQSGSFPAPLAISCQLAPSTPPSSSAQQPSGNEGWRSRPPVARTARPLKLPPVRQTRLDNGLTILVVEDHRAPVVTIDIAVPIGEVNDPPRQAGLAEATADLLTEGAAGLSSKEMAREVERLGGRISSSSSPDYSEIEMSVLAENSARMIEIAGDVLLRPAFPEQEVALYKSTRIDKLTVERQDPAFVLTEEFNRIIYGAHPYSASAPTPESVSGMNRSRIRDFYDANYIPDGSYLVAVGDFDPIIMELRLRSIFGQWKPRPATAASFPPPPARTEKKLYLIDRPASEQADIRIGSLAVKRSSADFIPLMIANTILGGGTSSRLFLNVRERKGFTYDISSSLAALKQYGTFFAATETRNDVCVPAISEILAEFDRIRNEKVSAEELQSAKNYIIGNYSLLLSTQAGLANQILRTRLLGLDQDSLQTMRARVEAVTADQVIEAARKYVLNDRLAIVVVGDAAKLKKALESLGPVVVLRGEGKPEK